MFETHADPISLFIWITLFFSSLGIFITQKMLVCSTFVTNGTLAQLVERGTDNSKVLCSRLMQTRLHFLFGLLSF